MNGPIKSIFPNGLLALVRSPRGSRKSLPFWMYVCDHRQMITAAAHHSGSVDRCSKLCRAGITTFNLMAGQMS
jgi:hypothetical protein